MSDEKSGDFTARHVAHWDEIARQRSDSSPFGREYFRRLCAIYRQLISADLRVLNVYSHLWEAPLSIAAGCGMARPKLQQNWLTREDVSNLLALSGFEVINHREEILFPAPIPGLRALANEYAVKLWPVRYLALTHVIVARRSPSAASERLPAVSVVVPARNEAGNIGRIVREVPEMGSGTEIVF